MSPQRDLFNSLASDWWNESGPMAPLHSMNPVRIQYILDQVQAHFGSSISGKTVLDVGCGAGILTEPLARLGAIVTGIDEASNNIEEAKRHWEGCDGITAPTYEACPLSDVSGTYDIITALEVIEHVEDPESFMMDLSKHLKPGGLLVLSTLNRTSLSYGVAILGAEYLFKMVPKGTHLWHQFLKPAEVSRLARNAGLHVRHLQGLSYIPILNQWRLTTHMGVNYISAFTKGVE